MQQSPEFSLLGVPSFRIRARNSKKANLVCYTVFAYLIGSIGQVSAAAYGESCLDSQKCQQVFNANYECSSQKCRRPPFGTEFNDILGYIVVALMVAFSNAGGMGAGSIIIPAYIFFYGFVATDSIPLSKITIFAGALMNIILVWSQRHPSNKSDFLINYGLAASVAPFMLAGTQVGVLVAKMLPPVFIWVTLISYLSYTTYKMYKRVLKLSPTQAAVAIPEELDSSDIDIKPPRSPTNKAPVVMGAPRPQAVLPKFDSLEASAANTVLEMGANSTDNSTGRGGAFERTSLAIEGVPSTKHLLRENLFNFAMMGLALAAIFATSLLRGGKGSPSILGIPSCSALSFSLLVFCQAVCVLISYCAHKYNKQATERHEGKVTAISAENKKKIIILSYLTGVASGSIGVGGGSILNPYMLELGVDPLTASSLSGFCILFSSSSTTAQFMIAGAIQLDHGLILMCLSAVGAIIGNSIIKRFIVARGKSHHIVWIVFLILALSMGVLPVQMWMELQNFQTFFKWGSIC